jgi:putative FmdB family regulatory protein
VPLYEYECQRCGKRFEKIEKVTAPHKQRCPKCGGRAERLLAAPAVQFKGSGWYATDYAGKSGGGEKAEKVDKPEKAEKSDSVATEAKEGKEKKEPGKDHKHK